MALASFAAGVSGMCAGILTIFGAIRVLYLAGVVALPAVASAVLTLRAAGRVATTRAAALLAVAGLVPAAVGVWASFVEPRRLQVETATLPLPRERAGTEPLRLGILADLQCDAVGDFENDAVTRLLAEEPDVILVPGDLLHASAEVWDRETPALRALLARLDAPGGVWFVVGDVDREDKLGAVLAGTRVRVLRDEIAEVRVRDRRLTLGGLRIHGDRGAVVERMERSGGEADIRLLLAHHPDPVLGLRERSRIDLVVAGHTHGGQVVVPGFGPPMTLSRVPREVAAGGLHSLRGNVVYVSRGVGLERGQAPPLRFLCPPEISVLTLRGPEGDVP
jgi:predicted MPP superfamily phosphohydrolase